MTRSRPPIELGIARDVQRSAAASRYVLGDLLGRGGMAEVFAGHSKGDHGFSRPVAIKRLLPDLATDAVFVDRLITEAKLLVGMTHGNIVSVIDLARDGDNVFLVMDYVDGPTLRGLIRARGNGPLPLGLATYVIASAAAGLEFAHARRSGAIIHADISPSNLLLTTSGEVRVADFGIAREQGHCNGNVEGKWAYMAPEQARGEPLTPASDVFALGVCLYELITGQHPFAHQTTAKERDRAPIVIARPTAIAPHIPPGLEAITLKALAIDPRARYQRMQHLIDALVDERFANKWRHGARELANLIAASMPPGTPGAEPSRGTQVTAAPVHILTSSLLAVDAMREPFVRSRTPNLTVPAIPSRLAHGTPDPDAPNPFAHPALSDIITNELAIFTPRSRPRASSVPAAAPTDETREAVLVDPALLGLPPEVPAPRASSASVTRPPRAPSAHGTHIVAPARAPRVALFTALILAAATIAGVTTAVILRSQHAADAPARSTAEIAAPAPAAHVPTPITATPIEDVH